MKKAASHVRSRRKQKKAKTQSASDHKWLIMVYMEAGDISNLDSLAVQDLIELQAGIQGTKEPDVPANSEFVAAFVQMQRKWPDLPQRYFIGTGKSVVTRAAATRENMASKESLADFLSEGRKLGDKHKATHYCLVLWGHNFGLGFGRDHGVPLTITHLGEALAEARDKYFDGRPLDLLATNSCTMAYIEAAFQLKESVRYLVASQVFMPPEGFPYASILRSIGADTEPDQLGVTFVDEYVKSFETSPNGEKVAMSLLDLRGAGEFKDLLKKTAGTIQGFIRGSGKTIVPQALRDIQDVFLVNPAGDARPVLDLQSLAQNLVDYSGDGLAGSKSKARAPIKLKAAGPSDAAFENLQTAAKKLHHATLTVGTPLPDKGKVSVTAPSLVLRHDEHPDLRPLGGVGVFAPFVVDGAARTQLDIASKAARKLYFDLAIFEEDDEKTWPNLVDNTLRREEPDEMISATGVVQVADRVQVNQMVGAIDAAFNTFDRVLKASRPLLLNSLGSKRRPSGKLLPFGPPRLKLAGDLSLQSQRGSKPRLAVPQAIVITLERIERTVGLVEGTIKRVMTNSAFGLGPPVKSEGPMGPPVKSEGPMGPPVKSEGPMGPPVKSEGPMGPPVKSEGPMGLEDLGAEWGALTAFLSSDTQVAMLSVTVMFRALASVLTNMERAVSNIELAAAQCQLTPGFGSALSAEQYKDAMEQRFARLFDVAAEASLQARRTARQIMAHPVYGLGRGPEDFGQPQREQLATSAGLSRRQLALL